MRNSFLFILCIFCFNPFISFSNTLSLYVGSPSKENITKGVHLKFDVEKEQLVDKASVGEDHHFRNLLLHSNKQTLYATGNKGGSDNRAYINRYEILKDGSLVFHERLGINNSGFCHLDLHPNNKALALADIKNGHLAWLQLNPDGSFKGELQAIKANSAEKTKLHCVKFNLEGNEIMAADIAAKSFLRLAYDEEANQVMKQPIQNITLNASSRYLYHHKPLDLWYLLHQRDGLIHVLENHGGEYLKTYEYSTLLPETDKNHSSDIKKVPNLPYMLAGNRVENSIAIFKMDEKTGELEKESSFMTGENPAWYFEFSPISNHLFVCYSKTNTLAVYKYFEDNGLKLERVTESEVMSPISVVVRPLN